MDSASWRLLNAAGPLPSQPLIARSVLAELSRGTAPELADLVEVDPSLSLAVLQAANAPHLRQARRVATVRQAMALLGTKAVESIATSRTAVLVMEPGDVGFPAGFWVQAISVAASASVIAGCFGINPEEAFTGGILHGIGSLILYRSQPEIYRRVEQDAARAGRSVSDHERVVFGHSHAEIGALRLENWYLPERIVQAVRVHHAAPEALTNALSRALWAGVRFGTAIARTVVSAESNEDLKPAAALRAVGLDGGLATQLVADAENAVDLILRTAGGRVNA